MQKHVFRHMRTAKAQISLRIHAVWSGPSLSANRISGYYRMFQCKAYAQMRLYACAGCEFIHSAYVRWNFFAWRVPHVYGIRALHGPQGTHVLQCAIPYFEGWAQDYSNSNIFLKPLFRGNLDPFVNNANLGAIAHTSNGT